MLQLTDARLRDVLGRFARSLRHSAIGALPLLFDDAALALRGYSRRWYAVRLIARAAMLAIVLAGVFAGILAAGDPVFRQLFSWAVNWSPKAAIIHLLGVLCWAWPVAGFLRGAIRNPPALRTASTRSPGFSLGVIDASAGLGAVNLIFVLFILVQLRVLFGGQPYVMATTGLTLAEYARSGFFVLVATAANVLMLLLTMNALIEDGIARHQVARRQAFVLVGLTGLVLVSAVWRMVLYVENFGLSLERVYALTALIWIGTLLVLFAATVLRGRSARFALGVLLSGWMTLLGLNAANPDELVVADSAARLARHQSVDWRYLATNLSADAIPRVVRLLVSSASGTACSLREGLGRSPECWTADTLVTLYSPTASPLQAAWSIADARARAAVQRNAVALRAISGR
jgi:hypothetical protein